ncbi:hypothetical protein KY290_032506 [Solanum tuberosum]|uniref:Uncharacterized protein n=1 Tax=Solanum tuberosum TaxID=4113 RepID=A0ABQ7UE41_SOLTU|nr:hypothetical protein KY290_032506 [Solanum tuberosum]
MEECAIVAAWSSGTEESDDEEIDETPFMVVGDSNIEDDENSEKGTIVGVGKIGKTESKALEEVYNMIGLKHKFLSMSQLCDKASELIIQVKELGKYNQMPSTDSYGLMLTNESKKQRRKKGDSEIEEHSQEQVEQSAPSVEQSKSIQSGEK